MGSIADIRNSIGQTVEANLVDNDNTLNLSEAKIFRRVCEKSWVQVVLSTTTGSITGLIGHRLVNERHRHMINDGIIWR